jgi:hypothetical protein
MNLNQQNELLTALLHIFPEAEVRHFDSLIRNVGTLTPANLTVNHILELMRPKKSTK